MDKLDDFMSLNHNKGLYATDIRTSLNRISLKATLSMKFVFKRSFIFLLIFCFPILSFCKSKELTIATWNLQHFGKSKSDSIIQVIAEVVKDFDIIAIQEVVGKSGGKKALARLKIALNQHAGSWQFVLSERPTTGNNQYEYYAFLWNEEKVALHQAWLEKSFKDEITREPYLGTFIFQKDTFTLVNFHAVPKSKQPEREIKYLKYYPAIYHAKKLIFLGDFNTPQSHTVFIPLKRMGFEPALVGQKTTLKMKCAGIKCLASEYDNIFFNTTQFRKIQSGIVPFFYQKAKTMQDARKVSDHVPVFLKFVFNSMSSRRNSKR